MPELTLREIDIICRDVQGQDITFSHLCDELADHICCDVEHEMQRGGKTFTEAYAAVRRRMGSHRRLREIQEETLYAVDTKYRKMKTTMKVAGIAGTILFGFASMFKIMHWPMAGVLMTFGAFTLAFVFLPAALAVLWKESRSTRRILLLISAFFAAMFFIVGILFKVQHWPGASVLITLGAAAAILLLIPALLHTTLVSRERRAGKMVYVVGAIAMALCLAGFLFKIMHWPLAGLFITFGLLTLFGVAFPWYIIATSRSDTFVRAENIFLVIGALAILIPAALVTSNISRNYDAAYSRNIAREKVINQFLAGTNARLLAAAGDSATAARLNEIHRMALKVYEQYPGAEEALTGDYPDHVITILSPGSQWFTDLGDALDTYRNFLLANYPGIAGSMAGNLINIKTWLPLDLYSEGEISREACLHSLMVMKNGLLRTENEILKAVTEANSPKTETR